MSRRNFHGRIGMPEHLSNTRRREAYARQRGFNPMSDAGTVAELRKRLHDAGIETLRNSKLASLQGLVRGYNEANLPRLTRSQAKRIRKHSKVGP